MTGSVGITSDTVLFVGGDTSGGRAFYAWPWTTGVAVTALGSVSRSYRLVMYPCHRRDVGYPASVPTTTWPPVAEHSTSGHVRPAPFPSTAGTNPCTPRPTGRCSG